MRTENEITGFMNYSKWVQELTEKSASFRLVCLIDFGVVSVEM